MRRVHDRTMLRLEEHAEHVTLLVEGPLTGHAFLEASKRVDARLVGSRAVWIDLKNTTSIDTGGVGVLLLVCRLASASPRVRICGAAAELREMLRLVSFGSFSLE